MGKGDMEIAVGLDRGLGLSWGQYRELGRYAVGLGYQSIWTNAANGRDSLHVCAQWSVATAEVVAGGIGTGISVIPIGYWSPTALASAAATVAEISGGKFVLGVGSGAIQSAAYRRHARVANDAARPACWRDGGTRGQGLRPARHQSRHAAAASARSARCPRPKNAVPRRRGGGRRRPELVHARAGGGQPR